MTAAPRRSCRLGPGAALVLAAALLQGCLVFPAATRATTGTLLPQDRLKAIRDGATSAAEVLEWLGPPLAVARDPGALLRVPEVMFRRAGDFEVPAASMFERFPPGAAAPGDLVYFYREHQVRTVGTGAVLVVGNKGDLVGSSRDEHREDRLWILVDGATRRVKAHVHERDEPAALAEPVPATGVELP